MILSRMLILAIRVTAESVPPSSAADFFPSVRRSDHLRRAKEGALGRLFPAPEVSSRYPGEK
jgi:hypothetical protein